MRGWGWRREGCERAGLEKERGVRGCGWRKRRLLEGVVRGREGV